MILLHTNVIGHAEKSKAHHWIISVLVGLTLNAKKDSFRHRNGLIRQIRKFKYMGNILTDDGKCSTHIRRRIELWKMPSKN